LAAAAVTPVVAAAEAVVALAGKITFRLHRDNHSQFMLEIEVLALPMEATLT
jgi:hypothetical protein